MKQIEFTDLAPARLSPGESASLAEMKRLLLHHLAWHQGADMPEPIVRRAVNEAESLATLTPFPALFFPALAEEKLRELRRWYLRQSRVRGQRSDDDLSMYALAE